MFGVLWPSGWKWDTFIYSEDLFITGQSYEIRMLDNRKIGELPEITDKMVKVRFWHAGTSGYRSVSAKWNQSRRVWRAFASPWSLLTESLWISEHYSCSVSWPTASVHRAPAAGRLALEPARGPHPGPRWAQRDKRLSPCTSTPSLFTCFVCGKNVAVQPCVFINLREFSR